MNTNYRFNVRKSVCFVIVMIGLISVGGLPFLRFRKVFSPCEAKIPDQILNDLRIVGLDLGDSWADIERTEGVYDWSSVDSELVKAEAHGKKVLLRIVSGGINVPDWLLADPNVQTFTFIDPNPYSPTYGEELTIPVFWDPIFLAKKIALIQAAGAHFAGHSNIEVVTCSFANATTGDWNIPDAPEDIANWRAAGYTTELMVNAGQMIIDATMVAFPNQNVTLSIGRGAGDLDPPPITSRKQRLLMRQRRMGDLLLKRTHSVQPPLIRLLILLSYLTGRSSSISARMWLVKCCGR